MSHVFISYSHKDAIFAQELIERVENAGFDQWIDREHIQGGQYWAQEIRNAIDAAYALILIIESPTSKSDNIIPEWAYAMGRDVPIIPILLPKRTLHPWLQSIIYLDFTHPIQETWNSLFEFLDNKRKEHGIRVRVPKGIHPHVADGLRMLNSPSPQVVVQGIQLLGSLKDASAVPGLVKLLDRNEQPHQWLISEALVSIGELGVSQLLEEFLKSSNNENKLRQIVMVLREIKSDVGFVGLLDATHDLNPLVRQIAVYGLLQMKRIEALPRLLEMRHDQDNLVRYEAVDALIVIGKSQAVDAVLESLKDTDKAVRTLAAGGLGIIAEGSSMIGDHQIVSALVNALRDPEPSVRVEASMALGKVGDLAAIEEMLSLATDQNEDVGQAVIDSLNLMLKRFPVEAMDAIYRFPKLRNVT